MFAHSPKLFFLCTAITALSLCLSAMAAPKSGAKSKGAAKIYHVVSFKFKDTSSREDVRKVEEAFHALKAKIPQIQKLVWGMNNSPEKLNKGLTHCWILTFNSEKDRDSYLIHPDHEEFKKLALPHIADVFVFDFWGKD